MHLFLDGARGARRMQRLGLLLASLFVVALLAACGGGGNTSPGAQSPGATTGGTPAAGTPAAGTPGAESPAGESPAGESPAGESPAGESPAGESPAGESPAGESPAGESPAGESPAAPGGNIQPPATAVQIDFWNPFTGGDGPFLRKLVEQFNSETPNVQVKFTAQPDYYPKLSTAKVANNLPHVGIVHLDAIPQQAEDQVFRELDDFIGRLGLSGADFTENVWNNGEWKGKRYGVPLDQHTMNLYWNKDLFTKAGLDPEKPPTTGEEFKTMAKAITDKAGVPGYMVVQGGPGANFLVGIQWATMFYQAGGQWTNEDFSQVTVAGEPATKAANYLKSLVDEGITPKGVESDAEIAAFKQGKVGMVMSGIWETNGYAEALKDKLGAGPVPQFFEQPGVWSGSHHLAITTREMSPEQLQGAEYFISWLSTHSLEWAKAGQIPASKSVRDSAEFKEVPYISDIAAQAESARFFPQFPASGDLLFGAKGAGAAAVQVITGRAEAAAAFQKMQDDNQKILTDNKDKYGF